MNKETDDLVRAYVASGGKAQDWRPGFSVAPSDTVPIIRERLIEGTAEREIDAATWGFHPSWAKQNTRKPINARLEGVAVNGMFRNAFASARCIVPIYPGYYEWVATETGKQPYFLHADDNLLSAAGLYAARKVGDDWTLSCTIITREARDASGAVHDRMPVFLDEEAWQEWTTPKKSSRKT